MYVGMGIEFKQLPLIAEGLAQAAVHDDMYYNDFFSAAERLASEAKETALPLSELLFECRKYPSILECSGTEYHTQLENGKWFVEVEMVRDGVCAKAFDDMARVCARYRVDPSDLERATAELINATGESQSL
jgi:Questin oxidase-like